jgi:hypothetical protein
VFSSEEAPNPREGDQDEGCYEQQAEDGRKAHDHERVGDEPVAQEKEEQYAEDGVKSSQLGSLHL